MIHGSCLCNAVQFEISEFTGPFELCHCSRCRKSSGSAFAAGIAVRREHYRLISGREMIENFTANTINAPPAYCRSFCRGCGCQVPDPAPLTEVFEIPAGLLDDDPLVRPDRHIFIDYKSNWFDPAEALPQLSKAEIHALRANPGEKL